MRKLIIVRHGEADGKYLTESGRASLYSLRDKLKPFLADMQVKIISSVAERALRSAFFLLNSQSSFSPHNSCRTELFSDDSETYDLEAILGIIDSVSLSCDVLIIVTHLEITRDLPAFFADKRLSVSGWPRVALERGEAYVIDCEDKGLQRICQ